LNTFGEAMKLIHLHIAKTAGTHLNKTFMSNKFYKYYDYCGFKSRYNYLSPSESSLLIESTSENSFITSHYFKLNNLCYNDKHHHVSVIRNPVNRIISEYIYKKLRNKYESGYQSAASTENFERWLSDEAKLYTKGYGKNNINWHSNWQSHILEGYDKRKDVTILRTEYLFEDFKNSRLVSDKLIKFKLRDLFKFKYLKSNTSEKRDLSLDEERKHIINEYTDMLLAQNKRDYQLYEEVSLNIKNQLRK
tara:strand:- start:520 stop:1266 length:747 start_codon:yes stop_codon:yes gene_type:complete